MTLILNKTYGYDYKGFKVFWINRALRLYPVYFIVLLITLIVIIILPSIAHHPSIYLPNSINEWLSNFTMLYPNIVPHRFNPRLVPPSWALTNELFFYLLISLGISKTYKRTMFWVILSVLYYVFTYKFYDLATFRYSAIPAASLPFSLGALLFWIVDKFKFSLKENYSLILLYLFLFYINGIWGSFLISIVYLYLFNQNSNTFKLNYESMPVYLILMFVFNFLLVHLIDIKIDQLKKNIKKSKLKT
jgi:peptidoglycan/LPS O-acetylase OafA/YrhL